jgi:glucoamylase
VDPSLLELIWVGVLPADHPAVLSTLPVIDRELGVDTPNGLFWHRYNHDGFAAGELSGNLAAGRAAAIERLNAIANAANGGLMLPGAGVGRQPAVRNRRSTPRGSRAG